MREEYSDVTEETGKYGCPKCGADVNIQYERIIRGIATVDPDTGTAEDIYVENYGNYSSILECSKCDWRIWDLDKVPEQFYSAVRETCACVDDKA